MTFGRRTVRLHWVALAALVAVLMGVPNLPGAVGRSATGASATETSPVPLDASAVYSGSFAARAGYDSGYLRSVSNAVPAVGPELVVVTFRPSDPSLFSPRSGAHPLSVAEIADRYGLSSAAYASAESYFESMGLTVVHAGPDRLTLTLDGTPSAIGRAFGTELESGTYDGRTVTFPSSPPSLPAGLEPSVASVTGLSSGFITFSLPAGLSGGSASASNGPTAGGGDLITPAIAREIYDLSSLYNVSGAPRFAVGHGIVLLLWGDGYDPRDLRTFFSNDYPSSFPQPELQAFPVDGAPSPASNAPNDPSKAPQELTLDMEWAGSMAPGATLDAVYAPDGPADQNYSPSVASMTDALTEAVTGIPGVSVISMSFGTPEGSSQSLAAAWTTALATATQEGITLLAATGDLGGVEGAACMGAATTDYPADSPDIIAVGGTAPTLARDLRGQVTGLASEPAWSGSGGGFSSAIPAPSWQEVGSAAAPISENGHRGIPDVAAAAANNFLYYRGEDAVAAGTSFATPLWAGLVTEMDSLYGSKLGFFTPRLYAVGAGQESGTDAVGLADVTTGSTCLGTATRGWDTETGWGSPRALLLYEDLTATFVHLTVSASPSPVAPGGTVTVIARLSNRTSGTPIVGVPVEVSVQASDPNGPCSGVWGAEGLLSNATGSVTLAVTVPVCFFGSHGTTQVAVTSDGYFGTNSTTFDVNLLGFVPALVGIEQFPQNVVAFALIMGAAVAAGYVLGRGRPRPSPHSPTRGPPPSTTGPPSGAYGGSPPPAAPSGPPGPDPSSPGAPPGPPAA
ncbi:MAG: protease pro-enzyme activation domain-containing protein [Thermoplasmata archaeon]|jgi:kumamolisin